MDDETSQENCYAVPGLVLDGKRSDVTSLFVDVRKVGKDEKEKLMRFLCDKIEAHKAVRCQSDEENILAFFNMRAKQFKHELEAVKTALEIIDYVDKNCRTAELGIGIETGKAFFTAPEYGRINYTCFGNFVNFARKLASISRNELLISKDVYNRTSYDVKSRYERGEGIDDGFYAITEVIEREKYKEFIGDFLRRQKEEGMA